MDYTEVCIILKFAFLFQNLKGTVSVFSSDSPCRDGNARFTTVPLKPLTDLGCLTKLRKHVFIVELLLANCFKL